MDKYLRDVRATSLFSGFSEEDLSGMLRCLAPHFSEHGKNSLVEHSIDNSKLIFIISGRVRMQIEDIYGDLTVLDDLAAGDVFLARTITSEHNITLRTAGKVVLMQIDFVRFFTLCPTACEFHRDVIYNLFVVISNKIDSLNQKIYILQNNTIRGKLMAYFTLQTQRTSSGRFSLPFNRGELADYIGANRSAMSRELHRMRDEGLIEISGSEIKIISAGATEG